MRSLAWGVWLLIASVAVAAQPRVALVIGNETYGGPVWSTLKTPHEDANAIAARLREPSLGFDKVSVVPDADYDAMWKALEDFKRELDARPGALAFFYFSGHGTFARGVLDATARNYMIPARSTLVREAEASKKAVSVDEVVRVLESAEVAAGIVVVDACRDNGLASRKGSKGLGEQATRDGFIVAYAAEEGRTAVDGDEGGLSPYATALSRRLGEPGLRILDLFIEVRKDVMRATGNQQEPTQYVALNDHFSLVPGHTTADGSNAADAAHLEARLEALQKEVEALKATQAEPASSPSAQATHAESEDSQGHHATPVVSDDVASEAAYRNAFNLLKSGRYDEAIVAFEAFQQQYPQSQYGDNAQFWLAEAHYVKRDFAAALPAYQKMLAGYPASKKLSHAMIKIGYSYAELGRTAEARQVLNELQQRYPDTAAAQLARERIRQLATE